VFSIIFTAERDRHSWG